jgi:GGDEF domain-containing protein
MGGKRRLSNNQKKRRILARRESDLIRALQRGESEEKVKSVAEEVRAARIRVLNMERSLVPPCDGPHVVRLGNIDDEIQECLSNTTDEIVQQYQRMLTRTLNDRCGSNQL